ncbi:ribonuclease domain-containing protein [Stenotrophomonas sp. HITSZ_GD]|uniref:ribonuclease domain-containing protein n=1 Tax=Stenotrophomonas sp. HITSZ_GD TaxID=3037248 RepID=UPI00240E4ABB|nr:ribonuclease domain-containing protein [Stenotrophomonas sp. HITSZ_GD]MDG2526257.1 ribonuclease domain-containing protein [Stenotrophomonas sp. HITSZ_GD]
MRKPALLVVALLVLVGGLWWLRQAQQPHPQFAPSITGQAAPAPAPVPPPQAARRIEGLPPFLPDEARDTIALIQRGGPYPHRQDGSVFGNREGRLPQRPRGYYHEYTVETPGLSHRGTRRIVTGGEPVEIWYYSDDHYETFRSFSVPAKED